MANELKFGNKVIFLGGTPITLPTAASDPGSAANGDMYYNTTSDVVKVYQAGSWTSLATGGAAANTSLSNLGTTSINADLIPASNVRALGSSSAYWGALWIKEILYPSQIDFQLDTGKIFNNSGSNVLDLNNLYTHDNSDVLSIDWASRLLADSIGTTQLAWTTAGIVFSTATATTVPYLNGSKVLVSSSVTPTELGYVSGVTSSIQTQLTAKAADNVVIKKDGSVTYLANQSMGGFKLTSVADGTASGDAVNFGQLGLYIPLTQKGANSGVATLDSGGKIPVAQLPNSIMEFQGNWDASTNTPTLADGTGNIGDVYRVNVAGTQDLGSGSQTFVVGDWIVYDSSGIWDRSHGGTDAVLSVNGQAGVVVLTTSDIVEGSNLYYLDTRAQDAVGAALGNTTTVNLSYNGGTRVITAVVNANSLTNTQINASAAIALTKLAATTANKALTSDGSGFIVASTTSDAELGYLTGVTSAIQTQLDAKALKALSNLASVAINTSLLAATDNTIDLGSDSKEWGNLWTFSIKHSDSSTPNLSIATTGNNGSIVLNANGTGNLDILATKLRRAENGAGSNFMEDQYFDSLTLASNTSSSTEISSNLSFAVASFDSAVVNYRIKEATSNKVRVGQFIVSSDGTIASSSDQFSETAALGSTLGLSFSADVSGGNVRILYNNTNASNSATMRCQIRRFRV